MMRQYINGSTTGAVLRRIMIRARGTLLNTAAMMKIGGGVSGAHGWRRHLAVRKEAAAMAELWLTLEGLDCQCRWRLGYEDLSAAHSQYFEALRSETRVASFLLTVLMDIHRVHGRGGSM